MNKVIEAQMHHDTFISYSSHDKAIADAICSNLENNNIRCWIAPRDILPGVEFGEAIIDAIQECSIMVLVFSAEANNSPQVRREVERALGKDKIIIPFRIENILPTKALEYALFNTHWLDAMTPPLELHITKLADTIYRLLNIKAKESGIENANEKTLSSKIQILEDIEPNIAQNQKHKSIENSKSNLIQEQVQKIIPNGTEFIYKEERVLFNPEHILFLTRGENFAVGTKDSKIHSFYYGPGTVIEYISKEMDDIYPLYHFSGYAGMDLWFAGPGPMDKNDKRVFFKLVETEQIGYLVEILGDRICPWGSLVEITIEENLLGVIKIKSDQILSISAKKDEISVQTIDSGTLIGSLQKLGNFNCGSFTMGPCLITRDAVIPLIRTNRTGTLTIQRIAETERPLLIPELLYCDRTQLKFRIPGREAIGHFNESVNDCYLHFKEETIGQMRIYIPQIKKLTVDMECKDTPVLVETFIGNFYRGTCPEQFNLSGTMISFDKVKSLVIEAINKTISGEYSKK